MEQKLITISKAEYDYLKSTALLLNLLEQAGVNNWEGYEDAVEIHESIIDVIEEYESL
jgi:hypothetical protein